MPFMSLLFGRSAWRIALAASATWLVIRSVSDAGVPEYIRSGFEDGERVHVGLLLRRVRAPRCEGNLYVVPGILRGLLDGCAPAQNDHIGERDPLTTGLRTVEALLDLLQGLERHSHLAALVHVPFLLRCKTNARPVRSTALVAVAVG